MHRLRSRWTFGVFLAVLFIWSCKSSVNLAVPRPYPCRLDGGAETVFCPDGWRCGLDGVCHDRSVGAPLPCNTDDDCEQGWRCDPGGTCVDAQLEKLIPSGDGGLEIVQRSPAALLGFPDKATNGLPFDFPDVCGNDVSAQAFVWISNGQLVRLVLFAEPYWRTPGASEDAGCGDVSSTYLEPSTLLQTPWVDGAPQALADDGARTWAITGDGKLVHFLWDLQAGTATKTTVSLSFTPKALQLSGMRTDEPRRLFVMGDQSYAIFDGTSGSALLNPGPTFLSGSDTLRQMIALPAYFLDDSQAYLSATSAGLYWAKRMPDGGSERIDGGTSTTLAWEPTIVYREAMEPAACYSYPVSGMTEPTRFRPGMNLFWKGGGEDQLGLATRVRYEDGGTGSDQLSFFTTETQTSAPGDEDRCFHPRSSSGVPYFEFDPVISSCTACPEGSALKDFRFGRVTEDDVDVVLLERRCSALDGGTVDNLYADVASGCFADNLTPVKSQLVTGAVQVLDTTPELAGYVAERGQLYFATSPDRLSVYSTVLDRLPTTVLRQGSRILAYAPSVSYSGFGELTNPVEAVRGSWYGSSDDGELRLLYASSRSGFVPVASVQNRPDWMVLDNGYVRFVGYYLGKSPYITLNAQLALNAPREEPLFAAASETADGGVMVVATAYDAVLGTTDPIPAEPPNSLFDPDDGMPDLPVLSVKMVPLSRGAITSLLLVPPEPLGPDQPDALVQGFLVAQGRIFRFRAFNGTLWRSEEVLMPPGEALELWTDRDLPRLGFTDGSVYALNSRVQLVPPLDSTGGVVRDYESICGQIVALTTTGLYRVRASDDGKSGAWEAIDVPSALLSKEGAAGLTDGKLYANGAEELYVFSARGSMFRVRGFACAQ